MVKIAKRFGFTLIELLIVVAIIAILAAIAVPNFLEAQTRAKISRCKSDQRSIEISLESYRIDTNKYPPSGATGNNQELNRLTTPIGYMSSIPTDPFQPMRSDDNGHTAYVNRYGKDARGFIYNGPPTYSAANVAIKYNICWTLTGLGPDRGWFDNKFPGGENAIALNDYPPYDSSNGSISRGNIERVGPGNIPQDMYRYIWNNKMWLK